MWIIFSFLCLINVCTCVVDEAYVRSTRVSSGRSIQCYSDGKTTLTAIFNQEYLLVDCDVTKDNLTIAKEFLKEALSNSIPSNVKISSIRIDVKKLGRKCQKYKRDTIRKLQPTLNDLERLSKRLFSLNKSFPGTKWCTRKERASHFEKLGQKSDLDTCCKMIHKCPDAIPAYTYRDGTLNFYPWTLPSCSCINEFKKCSENLKEDEKTFSDIYLKELEIPCLEREMVQVCSKHDEWGLKCVEYAKIPQAVLKLSN